MNRYSSLGAQMVAAKGRVRFNVFNIVVRQRRRSSTTISSVSDFLTGARGYCCISTTRHTFWKYSKAWELQNKRLK